MFRDEKLVGRLVSFAQGSASPLHSSNKTFFSPSSNLKKSAVLKIALIVLALLFTESSYAGNGNASPRHFSQKQITNFVKTVTTELELGKNWKTSFTSMAGGKLYCNSVVLGEGVRAGSHGLYTWFTCSAMHKLDTSKTASTSIACTGFSSPVWIQPTADSINFQTVASGPEYVSFSSTAPGSIKTIMDSAYNQLNSGKPRVLIARATNNSSAAAIRTCQ
jgi:hypothetical protein